MRGLDEDPDGRNFGAGLGCGSLNRLKAVHPYPTANQTGHKKGAPLCPHDWDGSQHKQFSEGQDAEPRITIVSH